MQRHLKLPEGVGLIVENVVEGSAAAKSGLQRYDVLHKLEDQLLVNLEQLAALVNIYGPARNVTLTVILNGTSTEIETILQAKNVRSDVIGFDAFGYFHGHPGRQELQNCAHCHQSHAGDYAPSDKLDGDVPSILKQSNQFDNYKLFHGEPGSAKLQECSACHARVVHPLVLDGF